MLSRFPTLYPSLSHTHSVCLSACPVCVCVFVLWVLVRTRCAQCSVGTLHCLPALVPGSGEGTALSRSPFRSLAQAQTESVFSSACLCICSLGPACESSNFLNSPPLTVSRPSATLSLGRVVARVCAGFALYSFISFTYFFTFAFYL